MRRRICVVGAALSVFLLAIGVASATASKSKSRGSNKPVAVTCHAKTSIGVPAGQTGVTPPVSKGSEYGTATCGKLGHGVQSDKFNIASSGDTLATYTWYLPTGTIRGKYDLTPQEGTLNFLAVTYTGSIKVTGGTGAFAGTKGTGTMTCSSPDSVHTSCTDKLKLHMG